jgi:hypothetical protein
MNDKKRIENKETLEAFINQVDGFHDALVHEAVLLNTGYVDEAGLMFGDVDLPNARLVIQSQFDDVIGVELDLKEVSIFNLRFTRDLRLEGEMLQDAIVLYPCGKENADKAQLRAKSASYRILGIESRGPKFTLSRICEDDFNDDGRQVARSSAANNSPER